MVEKQNVLRKMTNQIVFLEKQNIAVEYLYGAKLSRIEKISNNMYA